MGAGLGRGGSGEATSVVAQSFTVPAALNFVWASSKKQTRAIFQIDTGCAATFRVMFNGTADLTDTSAAAHIIAADGIQPAWVASPPGLLVSNVRVYSDAAATIGTDFTIIGWEEDGQS